MLALPLTKLKPVNVTSAPFSSEKSPPLLGVNDRSDDKVTPLLLMIVMLLMPLMTMWSVKVMSLTTLMLAPLAIALDRAEKVDTSVLLRFNLSAGRG